MAAKFTDAFTIHFKTGERVKVTGKALSISTQGDLGTISEFGEGAVMVINMREVFFIRSAAASLVVVNDTLPSDGE